MSAERPFRIRTITAGTHVASPQDVAPIARAVERAAKVRDAFEAAGYQVQNTRVAMPPLLAALDHDARWTSIEAVPAWT